MCLVVVMSVTFIVHVRRTIQILLYFTLVNEMKVALNVCVNVFLFLCVRNVNHIYSVILCPTQFHYMFIVLFKMFVKEQNELCCLKLLN